MDAIAQNKSDIVLWGTGKPTREFIYADDAAEGILLATEKYNKSDPVNLASGCEVKIKDLALIIKNKIKYNGNIVWDKSKPVGPDRRKIDISKAENEFGYKVRTKLEDGIQKTIEWYLSNN